jgi:hypothetical protein
VPRSLGRLGAFAPLLVALLLGTVMAVAPGTAVAADIDVEVDACTLLDDTAVERLHGHSTTYTTSSSTSPSGSDCFWGTVRPGYPGYVELRIFRQRSLSAYSFGDGCDVTPVGGVGEEAAFVDCPPDQADVWLLAYDRGAIVSLQVNEPAAPLTAGDLASVVRSILGQLPSVAASSADPSPAESPEGGAASSSGSESFTGSVPAPSEISTDPVVLLQSAALAALLVFLMPFPSQLFNSTLETHEDEVRRLFRIDRLGAVVGGIGAFWGSWPGVAVFTLLAALLYGFLDPGFGFDLGSLATFFGMLFGIVLVSAAFAVPIVAAHRRHGDHPSLEVVPISLAVGVACVLLSRLTSFQPGYLYGVVIGLAFARELSGPEEGRATAIGAGLMLAVAFVSWLSLGSLPDSDVFGLVVARTALAALMVAGLEGVVFGLLPMRFLPGEPLYRWNRVLWAGLLMVGAFAFFHILINPASGYLSDTSRTPLFTVVALLLGFSLVSVAFWAWFRFRPATPTELGGHV